MKKIKKNQNKIYKNINNKWKFHKLFNKSKAIIILIKDLHE